MAIRALLSAASALDHFVLADVSGAHAANGDEPAVAPPANRHGGAPSSRPNFFATAAFSIVMRSDASSVDIVLGRAPLCIGSSSKSITAFIGILLICNIVIALTIAHWISDAS